jgi:hypothetical protein
MQRDELENGLLTIADREKARREAVVMMGEANEGAMWNPRGNILILYYSLFGQVPVGLSYDLVYLNYFGRVIRGTTSSGSRKPAVSITAKKRRVNSSTPLGDMELTAPVASSEFTTASSRERKKSNYEIIPITLKQDVMNVDNFRYSMERCLSVDVSKYL